MQPSGSERRKRGRSGRNTREELRVRYLDRTGSPQFVSAVLLDLNEHGCGVEVSVGLLAGSSVTVVGDRLRRGGIQCSSTDAAIAGRVAWCMYREANHRYRVGISFPDPVECPPEQAKPASEPAREFIDYYEILQLSPNAEIDTIHRVYRLLAQRLHPDNGETGDTAQFRKVLEAYKVLSDPERRAAYDNGHEHLKRQRWRMFDQARAAHGVEMERVKRQGILALLYTKRVNMPDEPGMTIMEIEDLLGLPREHLGFSLWYLREGEFVQRTDRGYFSITARGVDEAEKSNCWLRQEEIPLLEGRHDKGGREAPAA